MEIRLSVAMIVRNEAAQLPECLSSAWEFADEICVLDTGSIDDTIAIAQAAGAHTSTFTWTHDFAAARNASLAMCSGDWIFILDADERIAQDDAAGIRAHIKIDSQKAWRFTTRNYTNNTRLVTFRHSPDTDVHARDFAGWCPSTKVRLFPRHPDALFEGEVHELINASLIDLGFSLCDSAIPVHHYPLLHSEEHLQTKRLMYLELAQKKIQTQPENPQAYAELAEQYTELGLYQQAVAAYRESLRKNPVQPDRLRDLGSVLYLLGRKAEAIQATKMALQQSPHLASARQNLGCMLLEMDDHKAAFEVLTDSIIPPDELSPAFLSERFRYIAIALLGLGRGDEARHACQEALRLAPENREARTLLDSLD